MKQTVRFSLLCMSLLLLSTFFCSATYTPIGVIPKEKKAAEIRKENKLKTLSTKLEQSSNPKKKARLERRIKRIKYGEQGDALGLAALLGGIAALIMAAIVLILFFVNGTVLSLLPYIAALLGAVAIVVGLVDMRYTDYPGQAIAAMIIGALGLIAGVIAIILVK